MNHSSYDIKASSQGTEDRALALPDGLTNCTVCTNSNDTVTLENSLQFAKLALGK